MRMCALSLLLLFLISLGFANDKKQKVEEDPVVFGILSQNVGCVIFKEYKKTNTKFWGIAITTKTYSVLEVLESQNYEMQQKKWVEDQDGANELQRIAVKDKVKFVKIPEKYSNRQLEKARSACKESSVTP